MKVKDVMQPLRLLEDDAPLKAALNAMKEVGVDFVPVGSEGDIHGMVTLTDVAIAAAANPDCTKMEVGDLKNPVIGMCNEEQDIIEVISTMNRCNHPGLLVRNAEGKFTGVVSLKQVVNEVVH